MPPAWEFLGSIWAIHSPPALPRSLSNNASGSGGDGLSNFGSALGVNACNCPLLETEDQYQIVNNWTKIMGTHSLKFGVDMRYARNLRVPSDSNRAGELHFSATDTENSTDATLAAPGGMGLASFPARGCHQSCPGMCRFRPMPRKVRRGCSLTFRIAGASRPS